MHQSHVFETIGDYTCTVAWTISIEFVACMSSENCCAQQEHVIISVCRSIVGILQLKSEQVTEILQNQRNILFIQMLAITLRASKKHFCHLERSYLLLLCGIGYSLLYSILKH